MSSNVFALSSKERFRRAVPKTFSYRYEIAVDAGPDADPVIRAGAVIIEGRYRGRAASFTIARSVVDPQTFAARGDYVHPLAENPMAYPPRSVPLPGGTPMPTPGFTARVMRASAARFGSAAAAAAAKTPPAPTQIKRSSDPVRPTPANEPASFRKTG
jgi:hypothetical protein